MMNARWTIAEVPISPDDRTLLFLPWAHVYGHVVELLAVLRSGFYAWLNRETSERAKLDAKLTVETQRNYEASRGTYGAPRVVVDLAEVGHSSHRPP